MSEYTVPTGLTGPPAEEFRVEFAEKAELVRGESFSLSVKSLAEVALFLAVGRGLNHEEIEKIFYLAAESGLKTDEANRVLSLAVRSGLKADEALSLAFRTGLKAEREVFALLHDQLLASFDKLQGRDLELQEWERPPPSICGKIRQDPVPFFLFKMKASAKHGQISWWKKKYTRFAPERAGYTKAVRVARVSINADGLYLDQAGEDGQPGAISYHVDFSYMGPRDPKQGALISAPVKVVAVVKRLPGGDGLSILSCVSDLGVKVHDVLFVMQWSGTVALSFIEKSFYVSSAFVEEPLYARYDVNFIDITVTMENLVRKLYQMYEQEGQDRKVVREQPDDLESEELILQREEQQMKKLEDLQRRRAESKKNKNLHKEFKVPVHQMKDEDYEACLNTSILLFPDESDWLSPSEEVICQNEERGQIEVLEDAKPILQNDLLDICGADSTSMRTEEPSAT